MTLKIIILLMLIPITHAIDEGKKDSGFNRLSKLIKIVHYIDIALTVYFTHDYNQILLFISIVFLWITFFNPTYNFVRKLGVLYVDGDNWYDDLWSLIKKKFGELPFKWAYLIALFTSFVFAIFLIYKAIN